MLRIRVYLLATGATTGATSQAQTFTNGIIGPAWKPAANSTTALQMQKADGTAVLNVDTTNERVGIGTNAPTTKLVVADGDITLSDGYSLWLFPGYTHIWEAGGLNLDSGSSNISIRNLIGGVEKMRIDATGVGIGTTAPATLFHALLTDAATNAVSNVLTLGHDTSGTAAAGYGSGILFQLESSTTAAQDAARFVVAWTDATHATRKADLIGYASDASGEREGWRVRATGSAPAIGFLGATPQARILHLADANAAYGTGNLDTEAEVISALNTTNGKINSILATLELFGFHATS